MSLNSPTNKWRDPKNIRDVKERLAEAHARDMRNALLVGRASVPLFHDALMVIRTLQYQLEQIALAYNGKVFTPGNAVRCENGDCTRYRNINGGCYLCKAPCL